MTHDGIKLLEELNFSWNCFESGWNEKLQQLADYKEKNGNTDVPEDYRPNPQLGNWVSHQRAKYQLKRKGKKHRGALTDEQIASPENLGFNWVLHERKVWGKVKNNAIKEGVKKYKRGSLINWEKSKK